MHNRVQRPRVPFVGLAALALLGTTALSACSSSSSSAEASGQPVEGGTLVYATGDAEPTCLDPDAPGNVAQALVSTNYLEALFFQDEKGEIEPWLAESWEWAEDHLSLDVTLRQGITFTDGAPLNAQTIIANVAHIKDPETLSSTALLAVEKIKKVEEVDEYTARLVLSEPDNALLEHFSQVWVPIHSQDSLERSVEEICESPVGTGPFKVESWARQKEIILVRNEDYTTPAPVAEHEGPAHLEKIVWRFLPDHTARFAALQSGEVDVIDVIQPQDAVAAESSGTLKTLIGSRPGHTVNIALNTKNPVLADVRVREAITRAIDIDAALKSIFLGTVERSNSVLSTITKYNLQKPEAFATDTARAEELLDEAGWTERDSEGYRTKGGKRLSLHHLHIEIVPIPVGVIEQFQASLREVGIELVIDQDELTTATERRNNWDYDLMGIYYTKNSPAVLNITHHTDNIESVPGGYHGNSNGLVGPAAKELDKVLDAASATPDEDERAALYAEAQELILANYTNIPLYDQQTRLGIGAGVEGVALIQPLGMPYFYDAWKVS